jgi:lyso-ornithine lipid O-acyltransferase
MAGLRPVLIFVGFLALTLPLMFVQFITRSKRLPQAYHRLLCKLLGMTITIDGALPDKPCLLVSNHVSWLDIPLLSTIKPLSFIAKREVGNWPLFGAMAKLQNTIFIDRDNRNKTGAFATKIGERLKLGDTLVLFPEGTSTDGSGVLPFKSSYFGAVGNLDVPVLPVTISYHGRPKFYAWYGDMDLVPHLWAVVKSGPIEARVTIHSALPKTDRKTMARVAEAIISRGLGESR